MCYFFEFHKPKSFQYIIFLSLTRLTTYFIKLPLNHYFSGVIIPLYLKYFSESLIFFVYFYQKHITNGLKRRKIVTFKRLHQLSLYNISFIWFLNVMCWCTLSNIFGYLYYYNYFYNQKMKNINFTLIAHSQLFIKFISYFFIENFFLDIKMYRHHLFALGLGIIFLIYNLIKIILDTEIDTNNFNDISAIGFSFIISLFSQFLKACSFSIPKKLNYNNFVNMNLILFTQGIMGILFIVIFELFAYYVFKNENVFIFNIKAYTQKPNFFTGDLKYLIIYCLLSSLLNYLYLKIIEDTRPSFIVIEKGLSNLLIYLIGKLFNKNEEKWTFDNYIFNIVSFIQFCIFCEVIICNFCELDKYTNFKTSERGEKENLLISTEDVYSSDQESIHCNLPLPDLDDNKKKDQDLTSLHSFNFENLFG